MRSFRPRRLSCSRECSQLEVFGPFWLLWRPPHRSESRGMGMPGPWPRWEGSLAAGFSLRPLDMWGQAAVSEWCTATW